MKMMMTLGLITLAALPLQARADVVVTGNAKAGPAGSVWVGTDDAALDRALAVVETCAPGILDVTAESTSRMGVLVLAPCHVGESVVLDHAGIVVQTVVAGNGALYVRLPILQADALVTLTYADGTMQEAYLLPRGLTRIEDTAARW
jgi:hypothetical protein